MRLARLGLVVLLAPPLLVAAAGDEGLLTSAEEVLAAHVEVTGGPAAYAAVETRWESGAMAFGAAGEPPVGESRYVTFMEAPNRLLTQALTGGGPGARWGSNGEVHWHEDERGAELSVGDAHLQAMRESTLDLLYRWRDVYARAELTGVEEAEGRRLYRVALHPERGDPEVVFLDVASLLVVRYEEVAYLEEGPTPAVSTLDDWRPVDGVLLPHRIVTLLPDRELRRTVEQVRHNIAIPEGTFDPPAEVADQLDQVGDPASVDELPEPVVDPVAPATLTSEPVNVWRTEPVYPGHARFLGIEGRVVLEAVITRHGKVTRVETVRAPLLDLGFTTSAHRAVAEWRYAPAVVDGVAVDVRQTLIVDFRLED